MWFVAMTKHGDERKAEVNLLQQGIQTYLPLTWRYVDKQNTYQHAPLFPNYIFFNMELGVDDWTPIKSTRGVRRIVRFGMEPARIPDAKIKELQDNESKKGVHLIPGQDYEINDHIRITDGLFKNYLAIVTAKPKDRLKIMFAGMNRNIEVFLDYSQAEPA